jgi:catechol 2,3-dioxygenase-like lactoylglutathione lyase family enzyme
MKFGAILLFVPDLDEARKFYGELLGLTLTRESASLLSFDLGKTELHIFRGTKGAPVSEYADRASTSVAFEVDSIESEMARLKKEGVVFLHTSPSHNAELGVRYAAFVGPGGNVHELIERIR